jgi:hypothetical protein
VSGQERKVVMYADSIKAAIGALTIALSAVADPVTNAVVEVYTVVETNWAANGCSSTLLWPPEANTVTHYEMGTIASNTYLRTTWSNYTHAVRIESCPFAIISRSYQEKVVREYR